MLDPKFNYGIHSTNAVKEKEQEELLDEKKDSNDNPDLPEDKDDDEEEKNEEDLLGTPIAIVLKDSNFRSTPSRENLKNIIGQLSAGTEVVIMAQNDEWSNICTETGVEGHILTTLLEFKMKEE